MSETEMVDQFIETKETEEEELTTEYALRKLRIEVEINELKKSLAEVNKEAKSDGIAIKQVNAALGILKKAAKQNPLEKEEEEFLAEKFGENLDISVLISELTAKE